MVFSKILARSRMVILYIVEENVFVVIVYKLLVQKKYKIAILKTALKLMANKILMPKKGEYVKFKNYERKTKSLCIIYADFESILVSKNNGKQNSEES